MIDVIKVERLLFWGFFQKANKGINEGSYMRTKKTSTVFNALLASVFLLTSANCAQKQNSVAPSGPPKAETATAKPLDGKSKPHDNPPVDDLAKTSKVVVDGQNISVENRDHHVAFKLPEVNAKASAVRKLAVQLAQTAESILYSGEFSVLDKRLMGRFSSLAGDFSARVSIYGLKQKERDIGQKIIKFAKAHTAKFNEMQSLAINRQVALTSQINQLVDSLERELSGDK